MRKGIVAILFTMMFLVSCGAGDAEKVAEKWLTAFWHLDYETAEQYSTKETIDVLKMFAMLEERVLSDSALAEAKKIKVKVKEVLEDGGKATVIYTTSAIQEDQTIFLVRQEGQWYVQMTKDDMFGDKDVVVDPDTNPNIVADTTTTQVTGDTSAADINTDKATEK
ncbi:MAG: DUF4878 domain-containing protein [Flavipsychrobacter sp.]|nr:DUF4878 domain-containing protein [Flavipsychrobacter sp.]